VPTFRYYLLDADGETVAAGYLNELPDAQAAIVTTTQLCQDHAAEGASGFEIWQGSAIRYRKAELGKH
jgi:hypothetical protein